MMMASGSAIEALQGWVTRIKAFVEERVARLVVDVKAMMEEFKTI